MKIKLVTFAPHPNFGTCLQSYALNHVLKRMGHEVEFIYNCRENPPFNLYRWLKDKIYVMIKSTFMYTLIRKVHNRKNTNCVDRVDLWSAPYILELPNHNLLKILSKNVLYKKIYKWLKCTSTQKRKVWKFTFEDDNFNMRRIYTKKQYAEVTDDADIFVTGSDQIWNPYCGGFNPMMFLEFAGNKKRIAYSSSISQPDIHHSVKFRMKQDLLKFSYIGVREQKSVDLLTQLLNRKDIKLVVDPTCLLTAVEWSQFADRRKIEFQIPSKYIFCYFVGYNRTEFYNQMVEDVKKFTGVNDVIILDCYGWKYRYGQGMIYRDAGPYEWVYLLKNASYVCMDSFHATIFSIIFHKEFVHALKNEDNEAGSQNTRIYDLFNKYQLDYKIYNKNGIKWHDTIDYTFIDSIFRKDIDESLSYLENALRN